MNRMTSRRGIAVLGISMAIAMSAGIAASSAQTGPRALPSSPDYQDPALEQPDRQFDRNYVPNDRGFGPNVRDNDRFGRPEDRLERRLGYLHTQLRITPAQERAWQALAAVLRDEAREQGQGVLERRGRFRDPDARRGPPSVLDRLEDRQQMLAERSADLDHIMQALRPLYASFNAEQRRTADRLMFRPGGQGFGNGRFGGMSGARGFDRDGPFDRSGRDNRFGEYGF